MLEFCLKLETTFNVEATTINYIFFTTRFNLYELWEVGLLSVQNNADTVCNRPTYNECSRLSVRIENVVECHMNPSNSV